VSGDSYVYVLFRLNGIPCYVGKGKGDRWRRHESRAIHDNSHLRSIVAQARKVGKELPKIKLRENLSEADALALERTIIAAIGREVKDGPLVNLTDGGDGESGYVFSPEARARMSATRRGRKLTAEHRAKIGAAGKGRKYGPRTDEYRAKISASKKGRVTPAMLAHIADIAKTKPHLGHKHSAESRAKISARVKEAFAQGRWRTYTNPNAD
jgi:hypothetical protein